MNNQKRLPYGGVIGGGAGPSEDKAAGDVDNTKSQHVLKRQKKKAKKKRKQIASSVVEASSTEEAPARPTPGKAKSAKITEYSGVTSKSATKGTNPLRQGGCPADTFKWMISPLEPEAFFRDHWEKKPLLIRRKGQSRYDGLFSSGGLDDIIRQNYIKYGINLDLARYEHGERTTENPEGRVHPNVMWAMYEDGCSVRMLNPQTYAGELWGLVSTLQEYFQCMVGCNTYLTPPGAQGFAPHYDDIEAFILQLEGEKRWRVYDNPENETLPRTSSSAVRIAGNFSASDLGEPLLDVVLKAGDLLYFPRGYVHQAVSTEDQHSLHLTVSTYQLFDWAQYMEKTLSYMGLANADIDDPRRKKFEEKARSLLSRLGEVANFDRAADEMAVDFIHSAMPSKLSNDETENSSRKQSAAQSNEERISAIVEPTEWIKLIRPTMCRLVAENESSILLYHSLDNGMVWHAEDPQSLEFPLVSKEFAPALELLLHAQDYIRVNQLPEIDTAFQQDLATSLFDGGLVLRQTQAEMEAD